MNEDFAASAVEGEPKMPEVPPSQRTQRGLMEFDPAPSDYSFMVRARFRGPIFMGRYGWTRDCAVDFFRGDIPLLGSNLFTAEEVAELVALIARDDEFYGIEIEESCPPLYSEDQEYVRGPDLLYFGDTQGDWETLLDDGEVTEFGIYPLRGTGLPSAPPPDREHERAINQRRALSLLVDDYEISGFRLHFGEPLPAAVRDALRTKLHEIEELLDKAAERERTEEIVSALAYLVYGRGKTVAVRDVLRNELHIAEEALKDA